MTPALAWLGLAGTAASLLGTRDQSLMHEAKKQKECVPFRNLLAKSIIIQNTFRKRVLSLTSLLLLRVPPLLSIKP